ncbi:ABC transporter substrate-binding protein [Paenibacillus sp. GCM10027628]|uniref:ABC transporter substrate-binding protein n=1 Tax=Paenibacillus sp. GCM10027628 TaxID=3273413 RepID=UPI003629893F
MKRMLSFCIAFVLALSALAGCSSTEGTDGKGTAQPANTNQATTDKLPQVTLKMMIPGDRPPHMDLVIAEAEKRMKDTVNAKLDIVFVPWADLAQKTQVTLASGENIDLIFDAPWLHINQMISNGYYEPLDDLLPKYGKTILDKRPKQMWDANKYDGKIMAIPLGVSYMAGNSYMIRKDIREKLGIPPIKTYDDMIKFAYAVKEKEKGIVPMTAAGSTGQQHYSLVAHRSLNDYQTHVRPTHALSSSLMLYYKNNDGKVFNLFEDKEPIWTWLTDVRKQYEDGLIYKDILSAKDFQQLFKTGKAAVTPSGAFGLGKEFIKALKENAPGADVESVTFFDKTKGANYSNFKQWNFLAVPKVSKNKERALMFLNWANEKDNYDLLSYGIKGKHWEEVGKDKMKTLDTSNYWQFGYVWVWNPVDERSDAESDPAQEELNAVLRNADNFTPDILTGFEFDSAPVQNDISQYNTIEAKYYPAMFNGVIDPAETMKKFEAEAGPALKKIQIELQKQIDAFLAKKK